MAQSGNGNEEDAYQKQRQRLVETQLERRGINNKAVLKVFNEVPRHKFVPDRLKGSAYDDRPLPIGQDQTISQPYIVAEMIQALEPEAGDNMLEIGIGSGYAAAILSRLVAGVHGVERLPELAEEAEERFAELGYDNVEIHVGDGTKGWPESAPYDGILVSAAAPEIYEGLIDQLTDDGNLVIPVGRRTVQTLYQVKKDEEGNISKKSLGGVRFVPLIGEEGWNL